MGLIILLICLWIMWKLLKMSFLVIGAFDHYCTDHLRR